MYIQDSGLRRFVISGLCVYFSELSEESDHACPTPPPCPGKSGKQGLRLQVTTRKG